MKRVESGEGTGAVSVAAAAAAAAAAAPLEFSDPDRVVASALADQDNVIVICLGVMWDFPCRQLWDHCKSAVKALTDAKQPVRLAIVDHSEHPFFCSDIIVGTPVIMGYSMGHICMFKRTLSSATTAAAAAPTTTTTTRTVVGMLTQVQCHKLVTAMLQAQRPTDPHAPVLLTVDF
eukprot:TRINITY_DN339_c0_g1_i1.p1 TRINITY_DN339_c0_g1~~TRINITY_DN339_c0_g1_i1.p1  ORF type:complete len:176 (-),score=57.44 TRINITY_DN339_c0_g1_i1:90-617(-)